MTGAGLYTYTPITDYDLRNEQNVSLLNGFRVLFYISNNLVAVREFDSQFWTLSNAVLLCFVNKPGELIRHPVNVGAEAWLNNFISFTAATTGTYTVDVLIFCWSSLVVCANGSVIIITS